MKGHGHMDMGMGGDASMPMAGMSLLLSCSCKVGPLFVRAWTIESCGQYYVSLVVIALVCFLRHLLTMYKTRLILRLPEDAVGAFVLRCMTGVNRCSAVIAVAVPPWRGRTCDLD